MRILIVSQYFWPENFRINELAAELVERGNDVTVLTGKPNYPDGVIFEDFSRHPEGYRDYKGVHIVRVPVIPRGRGALKLLLNYLSFFIAGVTLATWKLRKQSFDAIFVCQLSPVTSALPGVFLSWRRKIPLLLWILDLWPESLSAVGAVRSQFILGLVGRVVAFIYNRADRILVQSKAFISNVETYGGEMTRVRYFPGWAEQIFDGSVQAKGIAPELSDYKDTFNVLFAGNVGDAQDFPAILDAAEILRHRADLRWIVVGDGRAAARVAVDIERRALQDRVVMFGRFPIERMPSFFSGADALLVTLRPSLIFSLTIPGKIQSYLGAGKPILAMLDGEGARVIEEAGAGFTSPAGDARALARQVERMIEAGPDKRAEMGTRGRLYCQREFDRSRLISRLEGWMAELVRSR